MHPVEQVMLKMAVLKMLMVMVLKMMMTILKMLMTMSWTLFDLPLLQSSLHSRSPLFPTHERTSDCDISTLFFLFHIILQSSITYKDCNGKDVPVFLSLSHYLTKLNHLQTLQLKGCTCFSFSSLLSFSSCLKKAVGFVTFLRMSE